VKVVLAGLLLFTLLQSDAFSQEGGYAWPLSAAPGDSISFYVSTSSDTFAMNVYDLAAGDSLVATFSSLRGGIKTVPDSGFWYGCGWPAALKIAIPVDWPPGVYAATFPTSTETYRIIFVVRAAVEGSYSRLLVCLSTNTWQAYNGYGGKSLYPFNSGGKASVKVSFLRPILRLDGPLSPYMGHYPYDRWAAKLVNWFSVQNIKAEYCTNFDLDTAATLGHYKLLMLSGHDEYMTRSERRNITDFTNSGGRLAVLGGNTCFCQVRYEDSMKTLVCYRDPNLDPLYHIQDSLVTTWWTNSPVNFPQNQFLGVGFWFAEYVNFQGFLPASKGYGGYTAYNTQNWVYNGTGLNDGDNFGAADSIVGYETDGSLFNWVDGIPKATGADDSPKNFEILGISPASRETDSITGHATMGLFYTKNGGAVFNAATTNWADGLDTDGVVQTITLNVIDKFLAKWLPPEVSSWSPFIVTYDSLDHDFISVNERHIKVVPNDTLLFSVHGTDPNGREITYMWKYGNSTVIGDSVFRFTIPGLFNIGTTIPLTALVMNGVDTSSIAWTIEESALKITSLPPKEVAVGGELNYEVSTVDYYRSEITYKLQQAPPWVHVNSSGLIRGTPPADTGYFWVRLVVADPYGFQDSQDFLLHVVNGTTGIVSGTVPSSLELFQNYPNPFNGGTRISYVLREAGKVYISIYDVLGQKVDELADGVETQRGAHSTFWNPSAEGRRSLASGIYFCRLVVLPEINQPPYTREIKLLFLK
jgi:N,N-dimethylformamidase beta subunit-like, C-terminal/Putative Ig domain